MKTGLLLINNTTVIDVIGLVSTEGIQRVPWQFCDFEPGIVSSIF